MVSFSKRICSLFTLICISINLMHPNNQSPLTSTELSKNIPIISDVDVYKNGNEWEFLGKTFYDDFLKKYNPKAINHKKKFEALFGAGSIGIIIGSLAGRLAYAKTTEIKDAIDAGVTLFFTGAVITYLTVMAINYENTEKKASERNKFVLDKYLESWDMHKEITPESLHELFDKLSTAYKKNSVTTLEKYAGIAEKIHELVISNSPRYQLIEKKKNDRWIK